LVSEGFIGPSILTRQTVEGPSFLYATFTFIVAGRAIENLLRNGYEVYQTEFVLLRVIIYERRKTQTAENRKRFDRKDSMDIKAF
jgi:hypothetical protein